MTEFDPPPTLLDGFDEIPTPCLRIPFRVMLSWNDVIGYAKDWKMTRSATDKWLRNSRTRAAEVLQAAGVELEEFEHVHVGKEKKMADGVFMPGKVTRVRWRRAVRLFFTEPVGIVVRLWRPTALAYDIANLMVKPVVDGFVDVNILRDDQVLHLPDFGFKFHGIDRTLAFTEVEREARRDFQAARKEKGQNPKPLPMRSRIWFDFYTLSKIEGGSLYTFRLKNDAN